MRGKFQCLNEVCSNEFEHYWYPGDVNLSSSHAGTQCPKCHNLYIKLLLKVDDLKEENKGK